MNYSRKYIELLNKDNNFIQNNLEKVVRLLDVLKFISTELDPYGDKLVLKGGTAINLMYTNLARLSVDIDLDYIGSLDKENEYLEEFSNGHFDPYLLFEPNNAERAAKHPMAKWRAANIKK